MSHSEPTATRPTPEPQAQRREPPLPTPEGVGAALRDVIDPELGVNVVDLGLVLGTSIEGRHVTVRLTLTTPGCPLHGTITREAEMRVERVQGVRTAEVRLEWDPPWTPDRITDEGKRQLGW